MWGDVGVSGSADQSLAVIGLPPRGRREPPTPREGGWERVLARCVGHNETVTCCRLLGDGGRHSASESPDTSCAPPPPSLLLSSTAGGEMRVWDVRSVGVDPWRLEEDGGGDDGGGNGNGDSGGGGDNRHATGGRGGGGWEGASGVGRGRSTTSIPL